MPKLKPDTIFPTPEEERQIASAIASDSDDFEIDEDWIAQARPASEVFGEQTMQALRALRQSRMLAIPDSALDHEMRPKALHPRG